MKLMKEEIAAMELMHEEFFGVGVEGQGGDAEGQGSCSLASVRQSHLRWRMPACEVQHAQGRGFGRGLVPQCGEMEAGVATAKVVGSPFRELRPAATPWWVIAALRLQPNEWRTLLCPP